MRRVRRRKEVVVALDGAYFDKATTRAALRARAWSRRTRPASARKTVTNFTVNARRIELEYELIEHLHGAIPVDVAVIVLADRGFGDEKLHAVR